MRILVLLFFSVFVLTGCENFYAKYYDESIKNRQIECLKVEEKNPLLKARIVRVFKEENIPIRDNCPYTVEVVSKFLSQCNNPQAKSIGADFDGFLRFDLKEKGRLVYRCQMDWKGEFTDSRIRNMVKKMKKDLNFTTD
ncbi:hypothetical protein [Persephonella sp.]